jgi:hypothetical protein
MGFVKSISIIHVSMNCGGVASLPFRKALPCNRLLRRSSGKMYLLVSKSGWSPGLMTSVRFVSGSVDRSLSSTFFGNLATL